MPVAYNNEKINKCMCSVNMLAILIGSELQSAPIHSLHRGEDLQNSASKSSKSLKHPLITCDVSEKSFFAD